MRFNTHDRTPKIQTTKSVRILLGIGFGMIMALLFFSAIVCSAYVNSVMPAVIILVPTLLLAMLIMIPQKDMDKAFVEIVNDVITVTDFYFGIKKEKIYSVYDIGCAEVFMGYSMSVQGYRHSNVGISYIVFSDNNGKYMFKLICVPETKEFFGAYLKQQQS